MSHPMREVPVEHNADTANPSHECRELRREDSEEADVPSLTEGGNGLRQTRGRYPTLKNLKKIKPKRTHSCMCVCIITTTCNNKINNTRAHVHVQGPSDSRHSSYM